MRLEDALKALRKGVPVLLFDGEGREGEVDYVVHAGSVDPDVIYEMRTLAGGLICFAMPYKLGRVLGLRFATEIIEGLPELRSLAQGLTSYGDRPAFSLWVNHRQVRTGIRDTDRALTIRELAKVVELAWRGDIEAARRKFLREFMAPGHVPILLGRSLASRRGHTELSLHLALLAGLTPCTVLAEMLSKGTALSLEEARRISREYGYPLITSDDVVAGVRERWGAVDAVKNFFE